MFAKRWLMAVALVAVISLVAGCAAQDRFAAMTGGEAEFDRRTPWSPVQVSLYDPVQIVPSEWDVGGARLCLIYGVNRNVSGLDLGLWPSTRGRSTGLQIGVLRGYARGIEGVQIVTGIGGCAAGLMKGLQLAGAGANADRMSGVQLAVGGCSVRRGKGVQVGLFNGCYWKFKGVQVGLIGNFSQQTNGLQIGLLNFNLHGPIPFFPILNFGW